MKQKQSSFFRRLASSARSVASGGQRLLMAFFCLLSAAVWLPQDANAGNISVSWGESGVSWNAEMGRYEFMTRIYDFDGTDNWVSVFQISAIESSGSEHLIYAYDSWYQHDGDYVQAKVKSLLINSEYGKLIAFVNDKAEGTVQNYKEFDIPFVNTTVNKTTSEGNGWKTYWTHFHSKYESGNSDYWRYHYLKVYWYPGNFLQGKKLKFRIRGTVRNSDDKSWWRDYTTDSYYSQSSCSVKKPVVDSDSYGWNKANGQYVVKATMPSPRTGQFDLPITLNGGNGTTKWIKNYSLNAGESCTWATTDLTSSSTVNNTASQQFANGFKFYVNSNQHRSYYSLPWIYNIASDTYTSEKFATMNLDKGLVVAQNSRDIVLSWSVNQPSTGDSHLGKFGIQKYNEENKRWEEIDEVEFLRTKNDYSYTYQLKDVECNKGEVEYKFRVWKKFFETEDLWHQFMSLEKSIKANTDYRKIKLTSVSPVNGKTEAVVNWKFESETGVWDKSAEITLVVLDGTGTPINLTSQPTYEVKSFKIGGLQGCKEYTYRVSTRVMNKSYQDAAEDNQIVILQPDNKARAIENFEASKGFYSDYTLISWEVPADKSDFKNFEITRQDVNGGPVVTVSQLTHSGLTKYSIQDRDADAGVLYHYVITGYSVCNEKPSVGAQTSDIGFSQPYATVSGNVAYSGNQAVKDVTISIAGGESESANATVKFDGADKSCVTAPSAVMSDFSKSGGAFTFQAWLYPEGPGVIFQKDGVVGMKVDENGALSIKLATGNWSTYANPVYFPMSKWSHISIVVAYKNTDTYICNFYVDGKLAKSDSRGGYQYGSQISKCISNPVYIGGAADGSLRFKGNMDEIRFWSKALSDTEIADNYDAYISGRETNLAAYYRCDEFGVDKLFDISGRSGVYNKRHATLEGLSTHDAVQRPSTDQLANKTKTDEDGNYLINTIPYTSEGIQYNVIATFDGHEFAPSKKPIFASGSSVVFNNIDFEDKSSFTVDGYVYYSNTEYPVEGVNFYVDGVICSADGKAVTTDKYGHYSISVPIGKHHIEAKKQGHVFESNGRYPENSYENWTFESAMSGLTFRDSTLVVVAGRVCGGDVQAAKPLGLGQSVNNIGQAQVVLSVDGYRMNVTGATFEDGAKRDVINATDDVNCEGYYGYGDNTLTHNIYIKTDPATGEWAVKVPPVAYKYSVSVPSNQAATDDLNELENIDATNAQMEYTDSVVVDDVTKKFKYCASKTSKYNSPAVFTVKQVGSVAGEFGESEYIYTSIAEKDTVPLYTISDDKTSVDYIYDNPIFFQQCTYNYELNAFEHYENADDPENITTDDVTLSGATVTVTNEMSCEQNVYVEDGETAGGDQVKRGDFVALTENQIELDDEGHALYQWKAGFPSISGKFTLGLTMACAVDGRVQNWSQRGIVFGNLPSGNNFVTSGPDKVLMILRDPPGTGSSAYWSKGTTVTREETNSGAVICQSETSLSTDFGLYGTTVVGTPGFGVINEVGQKNTLEVGVNVSAEVTTGKSWSTTTTTTKTISTSGEYDFVGAHGDVFIGTATNIIFGNARAVAIVKEGDDFVVNAFDNITTGSTFGTGFNYTQAYIENTLLGNLELNRNALLQTCTQAQLDSIVAAGNDSEETIYLTTISPDDERFGSRNTDEVWGDKANTNKSLTYGPSYTMVLPKERKADKAYQDMVLWYNEQIDNWIQALRENEEAKAKVIKDRDKYLSENISFDAGAKISSSVSTCNSSAISVEREVETLAVLGLQTGFEINKCGFDLSVKVTAGARYSGSSSFGTETCTETGFELSEDGDDDALSVDVYNAPDDFGAIFVTRGGQTSCPYEGEIKSKYLDEETILSYATMKIEDPKIYCENPSAVDIPAGGTAVFTLLLQNESEIHEDIWFQLGQEMDTNPHGAILQINGMALTSANLDFLVRAGETLPVTLTLKQSDPSVLDYENIGISLFSSCQWDETGNYEPISSTTFISAHFVPSCTELNLVANSNTVNTYTGAEFKGVIRDYDLGYSSLKGIRVKYRQEGDAQWTSAAKYVIDEELLDNETSLLPNVNGRTSYTLDMSNSAIFPDGNYEIMAFSACAFGTGEVLREGPIVKFTKDMARPQLLGNAEPADGILDAGDEISITFNEDIRNGALLRTNNFIVSGILNDAKVAHDVALKLDGADTPAAATQSDIYLAGKDFTIDMWFKTSDDGTLFQHADAKNGIVLSINADKKLVLDFAGKQFVSENTVPMDKWSFLTLNYSAESNLVNAYIATDGESNYFFRGQGVPAYNANGIVSIGKGLSGSIAELALWNINRSCLVAQSEMYSGKQPSTAGLIGYWKFNEGHGDVAIDAARSRNMVLAAPSWYLNNTNYALALDGTGYADLNIATSAVESTADYLVEFWFRGDAQSEAYLWSAGKIGLKVNANGRLALATDEQEIELSKNNYLDNAWHSFALNVLRNGMTTAYVDGEAVKNISSGYIPAPASAFLTVGALRKIENNHPVYSANFTGDVDDIRLWIASFNATAIEQNRYNRLVGDEDGLVAYYPFESSALDKFSQLVTSFDAADMSASNAGNATLVGGQKAATAPALKLKPEDTSVSFNFVASERKIVINLSETAARLEGSTINFTIRNVRDVNENISEPVIWSAYINQNRLVWSEDEVNIQQDNLTASTFSVNVTNGGSTTENWQISGLPTWLKASKTTGSLRALASSQVTFTVDPSTAIGTYEETIYLSGNDMINVPLTVSVKVSGKKPNWSVNPKAYVNSMNVIGQLIINDMPSDDTEDLVAAFINDKCVGVTSPIYYDRYDAYIVSLDIYGNALDANQPVVLKAWDASTGITYPALIASKEVNFVANSIIGTANEPISLTANEYQEQIIALGEGWNWVSLYVNPVKSEVSSVFSGVRSVASQVKDKFTFAVPNGSSWYGSLDKVSVGNMYRVHAKQDVELNVVGTVVDPAQATLSVAPQWNWIGYNQTASANLNEALAGLNPAEGDVIKGQTGFAMFQGYEWVGSLRALAPGAGYMYYSNAAETKTFAYPTVLSTSVSANRAAVLSHYEAVKASAFSGNMTVIAHVSCDGRDVPFAEVGVFADGVCRSTQIADAEGRVFLTIPGDNAANLTLSVISSDGSETTGIPAFAFVEDAIIGSLNAPFEVCVNSAAGALAEDAIAALTIYPNPAVENVHIDAPANASVKIFNIMGQLLATSNGDADFDVTNWTPGYYVVKVVTSDGKVMMGNFIKK